MSLRRTPFARIVLASVWCAALPCSAAAQPAVATVAVGYWSHYRFAGIPFAPGDVTHADATVLRGALSLTGSGIFDATTLDVVELDGWVEYGFGVPGLGSGFLAGALYGYPTEDGGAWSASVEVGGGLTLDLPLAPTVEGAREVGGRSGVVVTLGLSEGVRLGTVATVMVGGRVTYNRRYWSSAVGVSHADADVALEVPLGWVTLTPTLRLQRVVGDAFAAEGVDHVEILELRAAVDVR